MMLKTSDIEKEINKIKENINNNNKSTIEIIKNRRIWTQKSTINFRNIIYDINKYLKNIRNSSYLLYDPDDLKELKELKQLKKKNIKIKKEEKSKNNLIIKISQEQKPKTIEANISNNFSRNAKDIQNKINFLRNKANDLKLKDIKSLKNISSDFCLQPKPMLFIKNNNSKRELKKRPTSASTYYESKLFQTNIKNKKMCFKSFREGNKIKLAKRKNNLTIKKENEDKINIGRLTDMYRRKINNSMNMYSPKRHLKDMKYFQLNDLNMRRKINNINEKIQRRIKNRCGGFYFKEKYEKFIAKNKTEQINKIKSSEIIQDKNKFRNNLALRKKSFSAKNFLSQKITSRNEGRNIEKENFKQKKENLKNILELLKTTLDIEPIQEYINDKVKFGNRINKDLNGDKMEYFSKYEEINKKIEEINEDNKETYESDNNIKNMIITQEKISKNFYNSPFNYK